MLFNIAASPAGGSRLVGSSRLLIGLVLLATMLGMMAPLRAEGLSAEDEAGLAVYKQANCMGCHKWHGRGGGGYGGKALSLRDTLLDADNIRRVVRCGLPATRMPYHARQSYQNDADTSCYNKTRVQLGEDRPPLAAKLLSDRQIDLVVHYVLTQVKGRGEPQYSECEAFWGKNKRQCDEFK